MAEPILYMGPSGVGKTSSLRNLPPNETYIITPNAKSLSIPGGDSKYSEEKKNLYRCNELDSIANVIKQISNNAPHIKYVVIEDFTHFFSARIFSEKFIQANTGNAAFAKWNIFGAAVFQAIFAQSQLWRKDLYVIVIHHTEMKDDGMIGAKTPGKLLDNAIDFPSYFTYIFHGVIHEDEQGRRYLMQTNRDAIRHAKTPYGVFEEMYIPNDMKSALDRITAYRNGELNIEWK